MATKRGTSFAAVLTTAASISAVFLVPGPSRASEAPPDPTEFCIAAAEAEEQAHEIPDTLLRALSLAESGRRNEETRSLVTWPWTVMADGKGRYYPSKEVAVAEVKKLQAKGVRNIDVGCMQINLLHHADAFDSNEQALDPEANVAYGARFLAALKRETGSWFTAVKRYHSSRPAYYLPYRSRVFRIWRDMKERRIAAAGEPEPKAGDISESMSATINVWAERLANLLIISLPESRKVRWDDAFRRSGEALDEWRRIGVSAASRNQVETTPVSEDRVRRAMQVLNRLEASR